MLLLYPLIKLRNGFSTAFSKKYPTTDWEPYIPLSVSKLGEFCRDCMAYRADPVHGIVDHIQPVKHMNWQLKQYGVIEGDCDDMATYVGYTLLRMGWDVVYRVNIVKYRHIICVFRYRGPYIYSSNRTIRDDKSFDSISDAVSDWCTGRGYTPTKMYYAERITKATTL